MSEVPSIVSKIERLFNKAAVTTNMHERDAFVAKAEALAAQYSVTEAMLAAAAPAERSKPVRDEVVLPTLYSQQFGTLANSIARAFDVDGVLMRPEYCDPGYGKRGYGKLVIVGFAEDVEMVKALFSMLAPVMIKEIRSAGSKSLKINMILAFARRVENRLIAERQEARARYEAETGSSTAMVLVDRSQQVKQEFRSQFPRLRSVRSKAQYSTAGQRRGEALGNSVDLGTRGRLGS